MLLHETVGMKPNAQHVDSKPREARDDIAENGHHHQAALPGSRTTVSIRTSFPGTSGSSFVISGFSFATWASALLGANNGNSKNRNTNILFIHQLIFSGCDAQHNFAAVMRRTSKHLVGDASLFQRKYSSYVRN